jgi:hypothetical protein
MRAALCPVVVAALLAACDDDPVKLPCDIREGECQKAVFRHTRKVRGQEDATLPPIRVIDRAQYRTELEGWFEQVEPDPKSSAIESAYALLGVLPRDMGAADEAFIDDLAEGVAAFYSPGNQDITIIEDAATDDADGTYVLAHEFIHALQHQRGDLRRPEAALDTDAIVSFDALIEGEAVWLSNVAMIELEGGELDANEAEEYFDELTQVMLDNIGETEAPLYLAGEILPYPLGGRGVFHTWSEQGLGGIEALHAREPATLAYWLADREPAAAALRCDVPAAPTGFEVLERDRLGVVGLVALDAALGLSPSLALSEVWRDDRVAIYASSDLADVAIAYRVRFASAASAMTLEDALRARDTLALTRSEDELLVRAASDAALLESWDADACSPLAPPFVAPQGAFARAARRLPFIR